MSRDPRIDADRSARDLESEASQARRAGGSRTAGTLWVICALGGLGAVIRATAVAQREAALVKKAFGLDPSWILGSLLLGGLALTIALWLGWRGSGEREASAEGSATPLRLLFEVLVLAAAAYFIFFQPFKKPVFDVVVGLAFASWGGLLLARHWTYRLSGALRVLRAAELVLFNLCLFAVLAEAGLRLTARFSTSYLLARDDQQAIETIKKRKVRHRQGRFRFGFPLNAQGHYDTDFVAGAAGDQIALIGDSFSFGPVPHHFHFTTVSERVLGVEIYNFGYPGIGPAEYLFLMRTEVLPLDPEIVGVNVFVGNDIGFRRQPIRHPTLRRWFDRRNLLVYRVTRRLARLRDEQLALGKGAPVGAVQGEAVARRIETVEEMLAEYPWIADPSLEEPMISRKRFMEIQTKCAQAIGSPTRGDYWALFEPIREMRRLAGKRPFVVHILPSELQVDDDQWQEILQGIDGSELIRDLPQRRITAWLEAEDIPYLDLLPTFRARCAPHRRGKEHCYHLQNTHFNARGNQVAGEAMAEFLSQFVER